MKAVAAESVLGADRTGRENVTDICQSELQQQSDGRGSRPIESEPAGTQLTVREPVLTTAVGDDATDEATPNEVFPVDRYFIALSEVAIFDDFESHAGRLYYRLTGWLGPNS
jgi:hypothetical protein